MLTHPTLRADEKDIILYGTNEGIYLGKLSDPGEPPRNVLGDMIVMQIDIMENLAIYRAKRLTGTSRELVNRFAIYSTPMHFLDPNNSWDPPTPGTPLQSAVSAEKLDFFTISKDLNSIVVMVKGTVHRLLRYSPASQSFTVLVVRNDNHGV